MEIQDTVLLFYNLSEKVGVGQMVPVPFPSDVRLVNFKRTLISLSFYP